MVGRTLPRSRATSLSYAITHVAPGIVRAASALSATTLLIFKTELSLYAFVGVIMLVLVRVRVHRRRAALAGTAETTVPLLEEPVHDVNSTVKRTASCRESPPRVTSRERWCFASRETTRGVGSQRIVANRHPPEGTSDNTRERPTPRRPRSIDLRRHNRRFGGVAHYMGVRATGSRRAATIGRCVARRASARHDTPGSWLRASTRSSGCSHLKHPAWLLKGDAWTEPWGSIDSRSRCSQSSDATGSTSWCSNGAHSPHSSETDACGPRAGGRRMSSGNEDRTRAWREYIE